MANGAKIQEIEIVELFDNGGKSIKFELLSKVEISKIVYVLITPFDEDEATGKKPIIKGSPADVFIMKEVQSGNEKLLEPLNDPKLLQLVYDMFKHTNGGKYNFSD